MAKLNERGAEILCTKPVAMTMKPTTLSQAELIRIAVRRELSRAAEAEGMETFEEADDFEVNDDLDFQSPWEEEYEGQFENIPKELETLVAPTVKEELQKLDDESGANSPD